MRFPVNHSHCDLGSRRVTCRNGLVESRVEDRVQDETCESRGVDKERKKGKGVDLRKKWARGRGIS